MKKRMRNLLKDNKGFTMIELMVVIVIMLILAAIAIPSFNRLIDEAKETAATSEARTVLLLAQLEAEAYEISGSTDSTITSASDAISAAWTEILGDAGLDSSDTSFSFYVDDTTNTVYVKCDWGGDDPVYLPDDTYTW